MTYQSIVNVDISLQATALSRAGFGTPIFATANRYFQERVRSYTTIEAVALDVPTDSDTYKGVQALFAQTPNPAVVKIGRIEADQTITPVNVDIGSTHSFTIAVNDGSNTTLDVSFIASVSETEEDVVDAFVTAITGDAEISAKVTASKTGTLAAAVLQLTPVAATDAFSVTTLVGVTETFSKTETATDAIANISLEDDDWYFFTSDDHTEAWVLAAAAAIEASNKLYFYSSQVADALATLPDTATEVMGKIFELGYARTVGFWHQDADSTFPECAMVGSNAPYDAGSVTWSNLQLNGVSAATDPTTGNKLSATQKSNLFDRNANTTEVIAGITVSREGKVAKGNFIDDIRGSDDLNVTMTTSLQRLLISQKGSKLPYTDAGIIQINSIMSGDLQIFVDRGFLDSYTVSTPLRSEVSANDIAAREYNVATFEGIIAGAIHTIVVSGVVKL